MEKSKSWRDASGRLTFDFSAVDSEQYVPLCLKIADYFRLEPDGVPIVGPDQMFWKFNRGNQRVQIDWDIWLELIVTAYDTNSENLAEEIANWIGSEIQTESN